MDRVELEIDRLMKNDVLERLLLLEKKKRGVERDKLVFVGMANVANYYWCAIKSILQSRRNELLFFGAYLHDRLLYSLKLGFINKLPQNERELLMVGEEITYEDVEKLLKEEVCNNSSVHVDWKAVIITGKNGDRVVVVNPMLPIDEREYYESLARSKSMKVADLEEFPMIRGELIEKIYSESYPTIRWNFQWENYVVIGVPDGITDDFVYEYKTTKSRFLLQFIKPVAFAQADLYGYFFKRGKKRIQIYITETGETMTWMEETKVNHALETLIKFKVADEKAEFIAPKKWKCKNCEFKDECPINRINSTCLI
jgi:CRISPR/Cas system-associated exonuclease Cas4 (RecB family)